MKRFEYKTIEISLGGTSESVGGIKGLFISDNNLEESDLKEQLDNQLNLLGKQGWELVSTIRRYSDVILCVFKREM